MASHLFDGWCDTATSAIAAGRRIHSITERPGCRTSAQNRILETVRSHYEDPARLADRVNRLGFQKASKILKQILPKSKKARSGHLGEIFAAEVVPALFPNFQVPIKRLRWLDGRESALRGEDIIAVARNATGVRFLKGESKSRAKLTAAVISAARKALTNNYGRPSQHAMTFIMNRLLELGDKQQALILEEYLLDKPIQLSELVHVIFSFSGNDSKAAHSDDLRAYSGKIEQHAVNLRIDDHQAFIADIYAKA